MIIDFFHKGGGGSEYVLPKATASRLGGIKVGENLSIDNDGVLSADEGISSGEVQTMIETNNSAYTRTDGFATINYSAITNGGNIEIQASDPNAEKVVELTQAEYNALSAYSQNTTYVITDATAVNMDDYALLTDLATLSGNVVSSMETKADKQNISAYDGSNYYTSSPRFPKWSAQGMITGNDGNNWGAAWSYINGISKNIMSKDAGTFTIFAPTTVGTQNQMLLSNGNGAPGWSSQKIVFLTQTEYDQLITKDSTTLYIITGD